MHGGWKWSVCRWEKCEGAGDWERGYKEVRMEAQESRRHPTMKDAKSSGAVNATEEKAND